MKFNRFWHISMCFSLMCLLGATPGVVEEAKGTLMSSYYLDTIIDGGSTSPAPSHFGTITFTDLGNNVGVNVDLFNTSSTPHKVLQVYLNYDDDKFDSSHDFNPSSTPTIKEDENAINSPGGYVNAWDLQAPQTGNLGFEPQSFSIALSGFNLSIDDFMHQDARGGGLFAGVHIGNYGGAPGVPGEDAIMVGASSPVPEPATMLLLGTGLVGFAGARIRKKLKK